MTTGSERRAPGPYWVLGASGLLGSAVCRAVENTRGTVLRSRVPWADSEAAIEVLLADAARLSEPGWRLLWCAGAAVTGSSAEVLERELAVVTGFLARWSPAVPGAVFVASSAGGVYAGCPEPPFDERTEPRPLAPYGHAKLEIEAAFAAFSARTGVPVLTGRIANLYGPGQDLTKGQGLISHLLRAELTGEPLDVYMPLDTMRDYLFVDDAAAMVLAGLESVAASGSSRTKILASGQSRTIAGVIGEIRKLIRRRPPTVSVPVAAAAVQAVDLRLRTVVEPDLHHHVHTPLGVGIARCRDAVRTAVMQHGADVRG